MKEFLDELKNIHRRFSKVEFVIVLLFILFVLLIPYQPDIIGFSDVSIHRQSVNLAVEHSKGFVLQPRSPVAITSLSVSGEVIGSGSASIYLLDKEGNKYKVFSNEQKGMRLITGFYGDESKIGNTLEINEPILDIREGNPVSSAESVENAVPGEFYSACSDTCVLHGQSDAYELIAYVEPGTILFIKEIGYTTKNR